MLTYPFTEADAQRCYAEWGANCGPNALAFILQVPLDSVREALPGFAEKRYTNPTMMRAGLASFGRTVTLVPCNRKSAKSIMFAPQPALVRVQWTGPWTAPGAHPKWAYRQTHWIVTYMVERQAAMVFDCNGGISGFKNWESLIVPLLTQSVPRSDGGWYAANIWRLNDPSPQ